MNAISLQSNTVPFRPAFLLQLERRRYQKYSSDATLVHCTSMLMIDLLERFFFNSILEKTIIFFEDKHRMCLG